MGNRSNHGGINALVFRDNFTGTPSCLVGKYRWFPDDFPFKQILVGGSATPLKNMSQSIGMMRFPIYGKITFMATKPPTRIHRGYLFTNIKLHLWHPEDHRKGICKASDVAQQPRQHLKRTAGNWRNHGCFANLQRTPCLSCFFLLLLAIIQVMEMFMEMLWIF